MVVRRPVATGFYSSSPDETKELIRSSFLNPHGPGRLPKTENDGSRRIIAGISPHAGYIYSGPIAAHLFYELAHDGRPETFVIIGPSHGGYLGIAIMREGLWQTPLGNVEIDKTVAESIMKLGKEQDKRLIVADSWPHEREHSLEVQLPFLQFLYGEGFKIVPIAVGRSDLDTCRRVGEVVAKAIEKSKQDIVILASTDMTHYGSMFYGFAPIGSGPIEKVIEWVYETDGRIISAICELDTNKMLNLAKKTTMCGSIPVAITMEASRALGAQEVKKLKYATSFDIQGSIDAIVGYLSIKITH
ncbi:MAG: AmmeMemoRadiSam system protein B [Candidatus Hodarchaeota archaeon]